MPSTTWTPTLPQRDTYGVYARWTASSANTGAAQYTVTHAAGTSTVTVNQKQNGGVWNLLGTWSFAPSSGHKVTLAASADGATIADAVLLVGTAAPPANLLYVHPDHLGTPQKITDAAQAIVWDAQFEPFGEEFAISALAEMPLRFPGQYLDPETFLNYNYLRDYDPVLGRYFEPDPVGLRGGLNPYAYVYGNPLRYTDPRGEFGLGGFIGGAAFNFGVQFLGNLIQSDWDWGRAWRCVNWFDVGVSAVAGAAGPTFFGNVLGGTPSALGGRVGNSIVFFETMFPLGWLAKQLPVQGTIGNACECQGLSWGNLAGDLLGY